MHTSLFHRLGILRISLPILLLITNIPAYAIQLADVEWQNRPLLLFAPNNTDMRLRHTIHILEKNRCELEDRDMILGLIVTIGNSSLGKKPISQQYATDLHKTYGVESGQFAAILIGKDGGEKYRTNEIPDLDEIFALIDGMPMRQDEMIENPVDCSKRP